MEKNIVNKRLCYQCKTPVYDDDEASICIDCGGLNRRLPKGETKPQEPSDGALLCASLFGILGICVGSIATYLYMVNL